MQYLTQHPEQKGTQKGYFCFVCLSVVNSCRETPGPIPNPEAKPALADGTATGRLWESKSPPTPNNKNNSIAQEREEDGTPLSSSLFPRFAEAGVTRRSSGRAACCGLSSSLKYIAIRLPRRTLQATGCVPAPNCAYCRGSTN